MKWRSAYYPGFAMHLKPGQIVDQKYRIVRLIGEGGMGAVYEGENWRVRRRVAIKVLTVNGAEALHAVERFEREAQAAGCIGSDHILEVFDIGALENGDRFMVMEYLQGETVAERLRRLGRLSPEELAPIARQICQGLSAAHAAAIVHRDLKPENIFILDEKAGQADFVKLIDFGISKFQTMGDSMKMTRTGTLMGTPYYMSPEQARGGEVDSRSDIYSLGVILYEALAGRVPFDAPSFNQLLFQIALAEPPPLSQFVPNLEPSFISIVQKAMARNADERFQSSEALRAALETWQRSRGGVEPVRASEPQARAALAIPGCRIAPDALASLEAQASQGPANLPMSQTLAEPNTMSPSLSGEPDGAPRRSGRRLAWGLGGAAAALTVAGVYVLAGGSSEGSPTTGGESRALAAEAPPQRRPEAESPRSDAAEVAAAGETPHSAGLPNAVATSPETSAKDAGAPGPAASHEATGPTENDGEQQPSSAPPSPPKVSRKGRAPTGAGRPDVGHKAAVPTPKPAGSQPPVTSEPAQPKPRDFGY